MIGRSVHNLTPAKSCMLPVNEACGGVLSLEKRKCSVKYRVGESKNMYTRFETS